VLRTFAQIAFGDFAQHSIYGYATSWLGPNFGFAKTSYMLETLSEMPKPAFKRKIYIKGYDRIMATLWQSVKETT